MLIIRTPVAMMAAVRRFFARYARLPEEASLLQEQASILWHTVFLFAALGSGSATLFVIAFGGWTSSEVTAAYLNVIGLYVALIATGVVWRRRQDHVRFIRCSVVLLACLGVAWGVLVNLFGLQARLDQQGVLIGLCMALVSAPMLGVPLAAALAFFIPISVACSVVIVFMVDAIQYVAILSFLGFVIFAFTGLISMNKTIMDRLIGRLNLQREHEIVRVFLREYEEVSSDWLWETDTQNRLCNVAPRMAETLHAPSSRLDGLDLFTLGRPKAVASDCDAVLQSMLNRTAFRDRVIAVPTAAGLRWLTVTGHPVHDSKGMFQGYRGIGSDITTAKLDQERIEFLARHDGLTHLLSRRTFVAETDTALADHAERAYALVLVDLDDFKTINDDLGHAAGDALLTLIAARLLEQLRQGELAARIGGDEFALLLDVQDATDALTRATVICEMLRVEAESGRTGRTASASAGIALAPEHGTTVDQLMRRADFALYDAKSRGKNVARVFELRMENAFLNRQRMLDELGTAIQQNQIVVEYQPIVDVSSGQLVSAEALVRWMHPVRGLLPAGDFVLAAEASDLIEPLGARVLRLACEAAMSWANTIPVAVNLSPRQLRSGRFVPILSECLAATGLPSNRLILEVTETVFLEATGRITHQLDLIRAMGVRLVLDDFGTGYSSLTYLHRFDVDGIKIDASFIRDLPGSRKVAAIVRTIGRLASDMNIYVTAEGVETQEQLRWLRGNGIAFAQGFLLGRPGHEPAAAMALAGQQATGQQATGQQATGQQPGGPQPAAQPPAGAQPASPQSAVRPVAIESNAV